MALFELLQEIAGQALGVTSPLVIQLYAEGRKPRTFSRPGLLDKVVEEE